ncbi:MAG: hypothetical protein J6I45_04635 [Clostridia bacterium]|nr:hypothetical protein [Clostridia bacterium]
MGFGLLLFGYLMLITVPFHGVDVFVDLVGFLFILAAMKKLEAYNIYFLRCKQTAVVMCGVGALTLITQVMSFFVTLPGIVTTAAALINAAGMLVFHYFMLHGIRSIARYTELPKWAAKAERNWSITVIYYVAVLALMIPAVENFAGPYFSLPVYVLGLVWLGLNIWLIFNCYARICLEGDEDMPYTPSKFEVAFNEMLKKNKKK